MENRKVAIVVGGMGLIGQAVVSSSLNNWKFISADIKQPNDCLNIDITSNESIRTLIQKISKEEGRIDAVINCAYPKTTNYGKKLPEVSYNDFCETLNLHLGGYFIVCQEFAKYFSSQGYGQVIQFASIYGVIPPRFEIYPEEMTMPVEYAAIKSAIIHLNTYFAKYYKGCNVKFNCISPGGIQDKQSAEFQKNYNSLGLNKGLLSVEDVVGTVHFLLSDGSKFINGQNIIVDDGWSL
jgi:NAD(P)-dependent dehydrogenase (short-subunit alcohol dehydrogenase family)